MSKPIFIKVGGTGQYDPAAGTTDCNIPILAGMEIYLDHVDPAKYSILPTGGFRMTTPFIAGDEYFVMQSGISYGSGTTSYSNGFNVPAVMSALFGRVGWMQPIGSSSPLINSINSLSKSGRYFNDGSFHSLVTIENIKATMELAGANDEALNQQLEVAQRAVILRACNGVFDTPEFIQQGYLYERYGWLDTPIVNNGKFVGWRFLAPPVSDLSMKLNSVSLYFNGNVTFPIYLFHDTKVAPIWSTMVTAQANTQTLVNIPDLIVSHYGLQTMGGVYYFGYFQKDLGSVQAIRETTARFNTRRPYSATSIEVDAIGANNFARNYIGYAAYQTYGINLHISVMRDHSQRVIQQPAIFDNLLGLQMSAQVLEMMMYSRRSNAEERVLKDQGANLLASMDLMGAAPVSDGPKTVGLRQQIQQEAARVKKSFYPCQQAQSIPIC